LNGLYPTDRWARGQVVPDRVLVTLGPGVTGPLTVLVGLYDAVTMARLPLTDARRRRLADDAVRMRVP